MAALTDELLEQYHRGLQGIVNGDAGEYKEILSERDDVTVANPFGEVIRGRAAVEEKVERAASNYRDGEFSDFEVVTRFETSELACLVAVERFKAKVGGSDEVVPVALRVTSVFRLEDDTWKLVHRHADPITTERPAESLTQQ